MPLLRLYPVTKGRNQQTERHICVNDRNDAHPDQFRCQIDTWSSDIAPQHGRC